MGFSLTGAHVIFFIAAVIAAGVVSGIFIAVSTDISASLSDRAGRVVEQLDTEFVVINDPQAIPLQGESYVFYLKNIGASRLTTSNATFTVFLDGNLVDAQVVSFGDETVPAEAITELYLTTAIAAGDHTLRIVGPQAVDDTFIFTIG